MMNMPVIKATTKWKSLECTDLSLNCNKLMEIQGLKVEFIDNKFKEVQSIKVWVYKLQQYERSSGF